MLTKRNEIIAKVTGILLAMVVTTVLALFALWLGWGQSVGAVQAVGSKVDPPDVVPGRPILIRGHVEDCAWLKIETYDARTILVSCQPYKVIATWTPTPSPTFTLEPTSTMDSPIPTPTISSPLETPLVRTILIPTGRHDR